MSADGDPRPVLVLGATGAQGGAVVRALLQDRIPVRALVRNAARGASLCDAGALLAVGNFDDGKSLRLACDGVRAVFSMQNAPTIDPGSERRHGRAIVAAARAAGVSQFIHTSVSGAGNYHRAMPGWNAGRWDRNYWESKADVEATVRAASFTSYTLLKPAFMMDNFARPKSGFMFPDLPDDALVTAIDPATRIALIAADDIGIAAAAALSDPVAFDRAEIELAGDWLTMTEIAAVLSHATGRSIQATSLDAESVAARGQHRGWVSTQEWANVAGYPARRANAQAFGLTPVDFATWARRHASEIGTAAG